MIQTALSPFINLIAFAAVGIWAQQHITTLDAGTYNIALQASGPAATRLQAAIAATPGLRVHDTTRARGEVSAQSADAGLLAPDFGASPKNPSQVTVLTLSGRDESVIAARRLNATLDMLASQMSRERLSSAVDESVLRDPIRLEHLDVYRSALTASLFAARWLPLVSFLGAVVAMSIASAVMVAPMAKRRVEQQFVLPVGRTTLAAGQALAALLRGVPPAVLAAVAIGYLPGLISKSSEVPVPPVSLMPLLVFGALVSALFFLALGQVFGALARSPGEIGLYSLFGSAAIVAGIFLLQAFNTPPGSVYLIPAIGVAFAMRQIIVGGAWAAPILVSVAATLGASALLGWLTVRLLSRDQPAVLRQTRA